MGEVAMAKEMVGGWTSFRDLTTEDEQVFQKAMEKIIGVDYTPLKVSTQVVNGTNYRFACESRVVSTTGRKQMAMVQIYQPLSGEPKVTRITIEDPDVQDETTLGGWSSWKKPDKEGMEVFEEATKGLLGVTYTPKEMSTQVVAGMNYRYKCSAEVMSQDHTTYNVLMEIYKPLTGDAVITHIERIH